MLAAGARVLDAGAGDGRYRNLFSRQRYEATDFGQVPKPYARMDFLSDLQRLPVASSAYDVVVCTQVLAHISEPGVVIREFCRVLKPGGELWLTCPLHFHQNEHPYENAMNLSCKPL